MAVATLYDISHKCGHSAERDLSNTPAGRRARQVEWWQGQPCPSCWKKRADRKVSKEVSAERDALRTEAEADQERSQLPILRGSDKQTSWALTVRFQLLRDAYGELVESDQLTEDEFEDQYLSPARRVDRAGWWIDNRDATAAELAEFLADPGEEGVENENPL